MSLFHHFLQYLRALNIVLRRRITHCITRLQTRCNILKYCNIFQKGAVVDIFNLLMFSTVCVCRSVEENHVEMPEIDEDSLVHPEDVTCNDPAISTAVQVISPIGKPRPPTLPLPDPWQVPLPLLHYSSL